MTSCDLQYVPFLVNECESEYTADYEQIFYDCIPFDESEPIGFSAKISGPFQTLNARQIVPFIDVISNFGDHYSTQTYSFTCLVYGVYFFSFASNSISRTYAQGQLFRNKSELIRNMSDNEGSYDSSSAAIIAECSNGDQVFVNVLKYGIFDGGDSPCHFSGYLLHKL